MKALEVGGMENEKVQLNRRPARRGIILIFIVVLLVLLAIMGVAFLTTARADRQTITGRGAAPDAPMESVLKDDATLQESFNTTKNHVMYRLLRDLFNYTNASTVDINATLPPKQYKAYGGSTSTYNNKDAYGSSDPYLASVIPVGEINPPTLANGKYVRWQYISAPLSGPSSTQNRAPFMNVPRFFDPRTFMVNTTDLSNSSNLTYNVYGTLPAIYVSGIPMRVPDTAFGSYSNNTARSRAYPAFFANGFYYIACDADGDGQADSGLAPIKLKDGPDDDYDVYEDPRNPGVVYFYGYRVVDNSAKVNVQTANSVRGDFTISNQSVSPTSFANIQSNTADQPNMGFSRSNVGMVELMQGWLSSSSMGTAFPLNNEILRLYNYRVINWPDTSTAASLSNWTTSSSGNSFYPRWALNESGASYRLSPLASADVQHLTMGDALEYGRNRRNGSVTFSLNTPNNNFTTSFSPYSSEDARALAYRNGGFLNPTFDGTVLERTLKESTYWTAVNFAPSRSEQFGFIPPTPDGVNDSGATPGNVINWFDWVYNFTPPTGWLTGNNWGLDSSSATTDFAGLNKYRFNNTDFRRSIRALLTGTNGVTATAPLRGGEPAVAGNPPDVLTSNTVGRTDMPPYTGTGAIGFTKASASTSQFGELWRAYWSIMIESNSGTANNPTFPIRSVRTSLNGLPSMFAISARSNPLVNNGFYTGNGDAESARMAILRSAIAALNTIDLRDPDDDLSWAEVKLDRTMGGLPTPTSVVAHVAGQEKQPYITGVAVHTSATAANCAVVVELYNPYNTTIKLNRFALVVYSRTTGQQGMVTFGLNDALAPGDIKTVTGNLAAATAAGMQPVAASNIAGASNFDQLVGGIGNEIFLVRRAKANQTVVVTDRLSNSPTVDPDTSLFPVDCADLRTLPINDLNYNYMRSTADWRFTYSGNWDYNAADHALEQGTANLGVAHASGTVDNAPVMQLQNFKVEPTIYPSIRFPYGSPLARDGDLLTIPFIGSYIVRDGTLSTSAILEINPITIDAYMSDKSPSGKQIGRFVPIPDTASSSYRWTQMLPEVISAHQAPNGMNTPDIPVEYFPQTTTVRDANTNLTLLDGTSSVQLPAVFNGAVANQPDKLSGLDPNGLIQGRINVNTAPDIIRRMLPWQVDNNGLVEPTNNYTASIQSLFASATTGFSSIYQINLPTEANTNTQAFYKKGDLSVGANSVQVPVTSGNVEDFEQKYLNQIRLSNLASTRSDSYTVYICVQAWRTDGTSTDPTVNPARLLAERRGAYLVDRGVVTPITGDLKTLMKKGVTVIEEQ